MLQNCASNDNIEEGLNYLCKASEEGFYAPSYTTLAKTLIAIAEKAYGTVYAVGKSPLPRVIQILTLAMDCPRGYGTSQTWEDETSKLLEYYESSKNKCSTCGEEGSETHPLRLCRTCSAVAYCSKVCQKKDYRDGHKFDCCRHEDLFDFQSLKMTLPWVSTVGWKKGNAVDMPYLCNSGERSLVQIVEDETDELYGEDDEDYDEYVLTNLMFRMPKNLETYLNQKLLDNTNKTPNLQDQVSSFAKNIKEYPGCEDFIQSMNTIRKLGNNASHSSKSEEQKLVQIKCEEAVREYRMQKESYNKYIECVRLSNSKLREISDGSSKISPSTRADVDTSTSPPLRKEVKVKSKGNNTTMKKKIALNKNNKEVVAEDLSNTNSSSTTKKQESEVQSKLKNVEKHLTQCIGSNDLGAIEGIIDKWKGVQGFAKLRKKAKCAAKK